MPASAGSDYGFWRNTFRDKSVEVTIAATDTGTVDAVVAPRNANFTLYIQRILLSVYTDAAQSLTFQDGAGTPVVIGKSPSSPGLGVEIVSDFGPVGKGLTRGEELDIVISGAGLGCIVNIECYEKLTGVAAYTSV